VGMCLTTWHMDGTLLEEDSLGEHMSWLGLGGTSLGFNPSLVTLSYYSIRG
jgi:hypothetical protein